MNVGLSTVILSSPSLDILEYQWKKVVISYWKNTAAFARRHDGTLSMEHEDSLMSPREGLEKGVRFLQSLLLEDPRNRLTWA